MWRFEALCKVPLLALLTPAQRSNLCTVLRAERHAKGEVIIREVTHPPTHPPILSPPRSCSTLVPRCISAGHKDTGHKCSRMAA